MYELKDWQREKLPVIPITDERVNFFKKYGVTMAAAAGCALRSRTLKLPAAQGIFDGLREHGLLRRDISYKEATSGRIAEMYLALGIEEGLRPEQFTFYMKPDVPSSKRGIIKFDGADIHYVGQTENAIQLAREAGGGGWNTRKRTWYVGDGGELNPDQYATPAIYKYYETWAAESILDGFGEFDVLVCPIGTGGTVVGLERGLRKRLGEKLTVVGAMCHEKVEIPGMRDLERMKLIGHPWREAAPERINVDRLPAFLCAPWVSRAIRSRSAPSGGAAYVAACVYLQNLLNEHGEEAVAGKRLVFVIHDEASQYAGDRLDEFPTGDFYPPTARLPQELIFG